MNTQSPAERLKDIKADTEQYKCHCTLSHTKQNLEWLISRIEKLEEALRFYADPNNWQLTQPGKLHPMSTDRDSGAHVEGNRARKALGEG